MIARTITVVEKNISVDPRPALVLDAEENVLVVDDSKQSIDEIVCIQLQNVGSKDIYYAYDRACDDVVNFNGYIVPSQVLDVPLRGKVYMYSPEGSKIAYTILKRNTAYNSNQ